MLVQTLTLKCTLDRTIFMCCFPFKTTIDVDLIGFIRSIASSRLYIPLISCIILYIPQSSSLRDHCYEDLLVLEKGT